MFGARKVESPQLFRKRDLVALILAGCALFLSLDVNKNYEIAPSWFADLRSSYPHSIATPFVTDLEGDGQNEVLIVTRDVKLQILSVPTHAGVTHRVVTPEVLAETDLLSGAKISKGRAPVVVSSGYLDAYDPNTPRQQFIAVLREDWILLLFDAKLNKIWEQAINIADEDISPYVGDYKFHEVAVVLSPVSVEESDKGLVIVGGSMVRHKHRKSAGKVDVILEKGIEEGEGQQPDMQIENQLEHFSVIALAGNSGAVRWHHKGQALKMSDYLDVLPQQIYKLDELAAATERAPAVEDWTAFRQSLIHSLPHYWSDIHHTQMQLAHFQRRHFGANNKKRANKKRSAKGDASQREEQTRLHLPGAIPSSAALPHHFSEHLKDPNVLVVHGQRGIEVFSLRQGRPVTSVALSEGVSYADINGDHVIDSVRVVESQGDTSFLQSHEAAGHMKGVEHHDRIPACTMVVLSGLPPTSQLFNASACNARRRLDEPMRRNSQHLPDQISAAPPALLSVYSDRQEYDVITAVHLGVVTAHSGTGRYKWRSTKGPTWSLEYRGFTAIYHDDAKQVQQFGTYQLQGAQVLVQGEKRLAIFSSTGTLSASVELPHAPVSPPILGDFDNDGVTDIIVVTRDAVWGLKVVSSPAPQTMFILCCILVLVMIGAFVANVQVITVDEPSVPPKRTETTQAQQPQTPQQQQQQQQQQQHQRALGTAQKTARRKRVYHVDRSTDD